MPEEHKAATEFSLMQDIEEPLASLPGDPLAQVGSPSFPLALRGYDRFEVDAYVERAERLLRDLHARSSPEAAVRRALEEVGEQVADILKRAHATAEELTTKSRAEATERLESSRREAGETLSSARAEAERTLADARAEADRLVHEAQAQAEAERRRARADVERITADGEQRVKDLDADADRIWVERQRILDDVRELAARLELVAESAADRFPPEEELAETVAHPLPVAAVPSTNGGDPTRDHEVPLLEDDAPGDDDAPGEDEPSAEDEEAAPADGQ